MSLLRDAAGDDVLTAPMKQAVAHRGGAHTGVDVARIGPNAIIQTGLALRAHAGADFERDVFARAGLTAYLTGAPQQMIPEAEAVALFEVIYHEAGLPLATANAIARDAGQRTGDYILANRIPKPAQRLLKAVPKPIAARALLSAIGKHSWTFAGSGGVTCTYGRPLRIAISANPLAFDQCAWHCAVFERLFATLVSKSVRVTYSREKTANLKVCRFAIEC